MSTTRPLDPAAFAYSPADAARYSGLGLTKIKALLRSDVLPFRKDGRRTLIFRADLEAYLLSLKTASVPVPRGDHGRFVSVQS